MILFVSSICYDALDKDWFSTFSDLRDRRDSSQSAANVIWVQITHAEEITYSTYSERANLFW